jgi:Xaa-Pro aminopeptidase
MKLTIRLFALALLAPLGAASDGRADEVLSLERDGSGQPVCGLGKDFHAGRRAELMRRVEHGVLLFRGLAEPRDYLAFHQDKTFWYLTGVESPDAALILDADAKREILLLPKQNRGKESWNGEIWDSRDEWVKQVTGFADVRSVEQLVDELKTVLGDRSEVWISRHPWTALTGCYDAAIGVDRQQEKDPLDGRPSREKALEQRLAALGLAVKNCSDVLTEMRRVKTKPEVDAMRRASRAGARAMAEAMRSSRPDLGEWDLEALMSFVQMKEGAAGAAYHAIVGSWKNSCCLHYGDNDRRMKAGEVVLIDYGPEVDHYTTDITRTWPVDGQFTPRMAEIYDAVLAAQEAGIRAVKPGATIQDVESACAAVIRERGFEEYVRHGACHYIGMEVHDPGDYGATLEPGVAFTVEPGIYDEEAGIGVRIEDVVVVTQDGVEVLSKDVPKTREAITRLVKERGVLDWMDAQER